MIERGYNSNMPSGAVLEHSIKAIGTRCEVAWGTREQVQRKHKAVPVVGRVWATRMPTELSNSDKIFAVKLYLAAKCRLRRGSGSPLQMVQADCDSVVIPHTQYK